VTAPFDAAGTEAADALPPHDVDLDALYAEVTKRANELKRDSLGGADALIAEIAVSDLPEMTFKPLAAAMAKATGFDADAIRKKIAKARAAREAAASSDTSSETTWIAPAANPAPLASAPTLTLASRAGRRR
jgi:hypothetical protein